MCGQGGKVLYESYLKPKVKPYTIVKANQWGRDAAHTYFLPGDPGDGRRDIEIEPLEPGID